MGSDPESSSQAIRLVIDDVGIGTQRIEHRLGNVPAGAISAIQTDLDTLERVDAQRDQVAHVAVASSYIVHRTADVLTMGKGQLRSVLIKDMELAVDVVLHQQQSLLGHLLAVAVDELDAVIVIRIVAGGDHNATVKVIHTGDIDHRRRGSDVQQVGVCAGSSQTSHETVLKHIRTAASILANDDTGRVGVTVTLSESIIIPAQESTNLIGMVRC